jgi:hypothetical protein
MLYLQKPILLLGGNTVKAFLIAAGTFLGFFFLNMIVLTFVVSLFPLGGDPFYNSYFLPIYAGLAGLAAVVATCTYILFKKIHTLLNELKKINQASEDDTI